MNELAQALAKIILVNRIVGGNAAFSERDTQKPCNTVISTLLEKRL